MNLLSKTRYLIPVFTGILFAPIVYDYFDVLWGMDYYKLFPLLLLAIGLIFWIRLKNASSATNIPKLWVVRLVTLASLFVLTVSLLYYTAWMATFGWIIALGAGSLALSRKKQIEGLFGLWCLTFLCLRLPFQMGLRALNKMELWAADSVSAILDYYKILHVVHGRVFALPEHDILLDKLLSGPVSAFSVIGVAAVIAVVNSRKAVHCVMLLICSILIAWVVNVLRLLLVVMLKVNYDLDVVQGLGLLVISLTAFLIGLVFIIGVDRFLAFFLTAVPEKAEEKQGAKNKINLVPYLWNRVVKFSISGLLRRWFFEDKAEKKRTGQKIYRLALCFLLLGLMPYEAIIVYYRKKFEHHDAMLSERELSQITKDTVLFQRPGWKVVTYREEKREFQSVWGSYSNTWVLKYNQIPVTFSFDYPFHLWHDVKRCYTNIGWKAYEEEIIQNNGEFRWGVSQTKMRLPNGNYGFILCSNCDHLGNPLTPKPTTHDADMFLYRVSPEKWVAPFGRTLDKDRNTYYQTQAMVATSYPLDEPTMQEIRLMYAEFREQTRQALEQLSRK